MATTATKTPKAKTAKTAKKEKSISFYEAIGRRKSAVAQVRLYITPKATKNAPELKKGDIIVNSIPAEEYFQFAPYKEAFEKPLKLMDSLGRFAISIVAKGGGKKGQLQAVQLGISRALELVNPESRKVLKQEKLLRRDARVRERRKPGTGGKARRQKQSPKR